MGIDKMARLTSMPSAGKLSAIAFSLFLYCSTAIAETQFPNRPIHLVVGFGAGGGNDLIARLFAQRFEQEIGVPVVVENKPGAGGRVSANYVMQQAADGYTILVGAAGTMALAPAVYPKLPYHPLREFIPLTMIAYFPFVLSVPAALPINSIGELAAYANANPDKSNYASPSPLFAIATEMFKRAAGMPGQAIPYKSSSEALVGVLKNQILFTISESMPTFPMAKGGYVRTLAVTGSHRLSELPDTPTMAEAGYPEVNVTSWSGLFVVAGTPPDIGKKLEAASRKAIEDPIIKEKLKAMGATAEGNSGSEFAKRIESEIKAFTEVVKTANLTFPE
jgi:tripartite-type tricarboxylate transporter receptor subunit TctC